MNPDTPVHVILSPKAAAIECRFCGGDFFSLDGGCVADSLHIGGRALRLVLHGDEVNPLRPHRDNCPSCGVGRGKHHHPGCLMQECADCVRPLMTCDCPEFDERVPAEVPLEITPLGVDENGVPLELHSFPGFDVVVHIDDLPDSDRAVVDGIPCTTALRTLIDCALSFGADGLEEAVRNSLARDLFTHSEALERLAKPDMRKHPGAQLFAQVLARLI